MPKHTLSPPPDVLSTKRRHTESYYGSPSPSPYGLASDKSFDALFYDELVLIVFSYLSWADLCALEPTSRNWARLACDNQLWKGLYLREFGRPRLRGARGYVDRPDGREIRPLPGRAKDEDLRDWKWMFRISSNWRRGRCVVEPLRGYCDRPLRDPSSMDAIEHAHIVLAGSVTITASSLPSSSPFFVIQGPQFQQHTIPCPSHRSTAHTRISALVLDQSPPVAPHRLRLACFISTGEFSVFDLNLSKLQASARRFTYVPLAMIVNMRTTPVINAVYHHPLLVTVSATFHISIYDLSGDDIKHTQTLTSFTSSPPTSLILSYQSPSTYKLILTYAIPVYPRHWSVGATEIIISGAPGSLSAAGTRSIRAFETPRGYINHDKLRIIRDQFSRKVAAVSATETDGKWLVLAPRDAPWSSGSSSPPSPSADALSYSSSSGSSAPPSPSSSSHSLHITYARLHSPSSLQLYRLSFPSGPAAAPRLTFVRYLHGQAGPVSALAVADGRCVSLSANGSIWFWDLENGTAAEVASPARVEDWDDEEGSPGVADDARGTIAFDDRRIVSAIGGRCVQVRRFDT